MSGWTSPYHRFQLWRNPFGELTREERGELAVVDRLEEWLQLLADPRAALQFVGDCGYGKTTHLLAIQRCLPDVPYVYYPEDGPRPRLPDQRPVIVDEAQRMGYWQRRRMLRGGGPLVVASHTDLSHQLMRSGFTVETICFAVPMQATTLARILNRRVEASRLDSADVDVPLLHVDESLAGKLLDRFGPNVREIEHFLYVELQHCITGRSAWPPAL